VVIRLYIDLVEDALIGPGYAAELAGISYGLSLSMDGITVRVSGYNDKLLSVLTMVLERLRSLKITQDRFEIVMEKVYNLSQIKSYFNVDLQLKRSYDNAYIRQTSEMVGLFLRDCLKDKLFTAPEKRKELDCTSDTYLGTALLTECSSYRCK
jgi:insulysin